jgi:hypothetical protein
MLGVDRGRFSTALRNPSFLFFPADPGSHPAFVSCAQFFRGGWVVSPGEKAAIDPEADAAAQYLNAEGVERLGVRPVRTAE